MPSCAEHIRQADKDHKARFQFRIRLPFVDQLQVEHRMVIPASLRQLFCHRHLHFNIENSIFIIFCIDVQADAPGICVWFYLFLKFRILHAADRIPIYFDPLHSHAPSVNLDFCIFRRLSSLIISKFSGAIKPPRFFMASQSFSANFSQKLYIILTIFSIPTLWISIVFQKKLCYNQGCSSSSAQRFAGVPQRGSAPAFGYHKGGKGRLPRPHESMLSSWNRYRFHYC